jgi:P-type E1-E2 ATPase
MIKIDIPGYKQIEAIHLVLDYNGTLAIDGLIKKGVRELLNILASTIKIHIVTADTFHKAKDELKSITCELVILNGEKQDQQKAQYIAGLGIENVIAIGNGLNDATMLKNAAIGIAVIQREGAAKETLLNCDVVCFNIIDALELLSNPKRLVATLRN